MHLTLTLTPFNCILLIILTILILTILIALYDYITGTDEELDSYLDHLRDFPATPTLPEDPPILPDEWRDPPCNTPDV